MGTTPRKQGRAPIFQKISGRPLIKIEGTWDEHYGDWYVEFVWPEGGQRETWRRKSGPLQLWTLAGSAPEPHHPEVNLPAADPPAVDAQTGHEPGAELARGESEEAVDASRDEPPTSGVGALSLDDTPLSEGTGADDARASKDVDDVEVFSIPAEWSGLERLTIDELRAQCQELGVSYELESKVNDDRTRKTELIKRIVEKVDIVAALRRRLQSNDLEPLQTSMQTGVMESQVAEISPESRPEYLLADRISYLSDEQRAILLPILELNVQSAEGTDLVRENLARMVLKNEHLRSDNAGLRKELAKQREDCELREASVRKTLVKQGKIPKGGKFMKRQEFRNLLEAAGLLESSPGSPRDGQDVYHIIATAHGGPDHTDNYLFTLGASFNRSISDKYDTFNLFMAGKMKAQKAVAIALEVAKDKGLHDRIENRPGSKQRTIFTQSVHKKYIEKYPNNRIDLADAMYHDGAKFMLAMRRVARDQDALYKRSFDDIKRVAAEYGAIKLSNAQILQILESDDDGDQS